jgi:hypothetical protein
VAQPLRAALQLPYTTQQLGVLEMCYVPTVAAQALRAQLAFLARVCSPTMLPDSHPTKRLHLATLDDISPRTSLPWNVLRPAVALNTSTYLCASVYPRVCHSTSLVQKLDPATRHILCPSPLPHWDKGVRYWDQRSSARRKWAKANYTAIQLTDAVTWSALAAQHLTHAHIRQLRDLQSHAEWVATHAPPAAPVASVALSSPAPAHATTAPLTVCKPFPGLSSFLSRHFPGTHRQRVARARLLMGRARTGTVLQRFAKAVDTASASVTLHCAACSTSTHPVLDSISHMLLECTRHQQERAQLSADVDTLGLSPALSLSTILVASKPPPPFPSTDLPLLFRVTATFLSAVTTGRATANLVPLDTG